jgi:hypothetical protein
MSMSLMAIMRDPDMAKRLEQGRKEVVQTKAKLSENATQYAQIYKAEVAEGTRQRQLLLTAGARDGKDESAVLREYGKFIPSDKTPIMNFLYFLMRDGDHPDWMGTYKQMNVVLGHSHTETAKQVAQAVTEDELDQIFGVLIHEEERYANVQEPQDMDRFIYGEMSHPMYQKIKKLKTLSQSENQNEAFIAYRLCLKLCKKYSLEFDKVGTYTE